MSVQPLAVECTTCNAKPWQVCTKPSNSGRTPVTWFHTVRTTLAYETEVPDLEPSRLEIVARVLLTSLKNDRAVVMVTCDCGRDLDITQETVTEQMMGLLEHAAHEHTGRRDLLVHRAETLTTGYELGTMLHLAPLTEAERAWRETTDPLGSRA